MKTIFSKKNIGQLISVINYHYDKYDRVIQADELEIEKEAECKSYTKQETFRYLNDSSTFMTKNKKIFIYHKLLPKSPSQINKGYKPEVCDSGLVDSYQNSYIYLDDTISIYYRKNEFSKTGPDYIEISKKDKNDSAIFRMMFYIKPGNIKPGKLSDVLDTIGKLFEHEHFVHYERFIIATNIFYISSYNNNGELESRKMGNHIEDMQYFLKHTIYRYINQPTSDLLFKTLWNCCAQYKYIYKYKTQ